MKRYENMNKEEIVKLISLDTGCLDCPLYKERKCSKPIGKGCSEAIKDYLNEELIPRIAKINTIEELEKAYKDFRGYCDGTRCSACQYCRGTVELTRCFANYLEEEEDKNV